MTKYNKTIILDCYTDEPSGYGARPYLGTHQIHLSQALSYKNEAFSYLTIDDLRFANGEKEAENTNIRILNKTKNAPYALDIIKNAETIYIIMGCFVEYKYFSCEPPSIEEVYTFLNNTKAKKILFYVLGIENNVCSAYQSSHLAKIIDTVCIGNTYRFVLENSTTGNFLLPNYELLDKISSQPVHIIEQLNYPILAEIETGTGCNTPTCSYCIEAKRHIRPSYREPISIVKQITALYKSGVRHFRLGRQPNFFHYQYNSIEKLRKLLYGIREIGTDIQTLHIDNVNMNSVVEPHGREFVKLVVENCTDGNVAPFGIESFDDSVRKATHIYGSADKIINAIEIINEYGAEIGPKGFPKFLPGINLMHGLPGQTEKTHEINMEFLNRIYQNQLQTHRLFYRYMTPAEGVISSQIKEDIEYYSRCKNDIMTNFVIPMQKRVYPIGRQLKSFREVVFENGASYLRALGTCSIKVMIENKKLTPYDNYSIQILDTVEPKLLKGEIIKGN